MHNHYVLVIWRLKSVPMHGNVSRITRIAYHTLLRFVQAAGFVYHDCQNAFERSEVNDESNAKSDNHSMN